MATAKAFQAKFGELAGEFMSAAVDLESRSLPAISDANRVFGESVGALAKSVHQWLTEQRERTIATLSDALQRPSPDEAVMLARMFADRALGDSAPLVLTDTVIHSEGRIRALALRALRADFGEEAFTALLYVALHDPDQGLEAYFALKSLKGRDPRREEVELMLKNAVVPVFGARKTLEWAACRVIDTVRTVFRSADKRGKIILADVFSDVGKFAASAVPDLISSLSDSDAKVRGAAVLALKAIGPKAKDAVGALERLRAEDKRYSVREKARRALDAIRGS